MLLSILSSYLWPWRPIFSKLCRDDRMDLNKYYDWKTNYYERLVATMFTLFLGMGYRIW